MPSAQTVVSKPEKSVVQELSEPYKTVLAVIEKKVRNLEKRKEKLDGYKKLLSSGEVLNEDQKKAVACYPDVVSSLTLAQEFSKQFVGLAADYEKQEKKRKKREAQEKLLQDSLKIKDVLLVQDILNSMSPEVHGDFLNGINGACQLTEEQLKQLDDFFPLINPREEQGEEGFQARLTASAEHLANLLEGKAKEVVGTTYRELKDVVFRIIDSKYFEEKAVPQVQPEPEVEPEPEPEAVEPEVLQADNEIPEVIEEPVSTEVIPPVVPKIETTHFYRRDVPVVPEVVPVLPAPVSVVIPRVPVIPAPTDVISDVQQGGAFNFIQESELESPLSHPVNVDPAVMMVTPQSFPINPYVSLASIAPISYGIPVSLGSGHRPPSPPPQIPLPAREEQLKQETENQEEKSEPEPVETPEEPTPSAPVTETPVAIDNWEEKPESPKEESNVWQTRDRPRGERGGYRGGRGDYRGERGEFRGRGRGERREGGYQNGRGGGRGRDDRYSDRGYDNWGDRERNYERRERNYEDREQGYGDRERYYDRNNGGERGRGGYRGSRGGNRGGEPRGRGGYGRGGYSDRGGNRS